jgi:hypothetical protein
MQHVSLPNVSSRSPAAVTGQTSDKRPRPNRFWLSSCPLSTHSRQRKAPRINAEAPPRSQRECPSLSFERERVPTLQDYGCIQSDIGAIRLPDPALSYDNIGDEIPPMDPASMWLHGAARLKVPAKAWLWLRPFSYQNFLFHRLGSAVDCLSNGVQFVELLLAGEVRVTRFLCSLNRGEETRWINHRQWQSPARVDAAIAIPVEKELTGAKIHHQERLPVENSVTGHVEGCYGVQPF